MAPPEAAQANTHEILTPWDRVQLARQPQRPHTLDYVRTLCDDFLELHGDRRFGDDAAVVGGMASFQGRSVMIVGHQKGSDTRENVKRRFGMTNPEGNRKALRLFRHAEKFRMPVICFVDTPGANPTREPEERGQANSIAENILAMCELKVPIIVCIIGEGGSGGALALGIGDRLLMLENAIYSTASPEASASILWRDSSKAPEAAKAMRITAQDILELGIIEEIVPEPTGGAHTDAEGTIATVGNILRKHLDELCALDLPTLLTQRYAKYRSIGQYQEGVHSMFAEASA